MDFWSTHIYIYTTAVGLWSLVLLLLPPCTRMTILRVSLCLCLSLLLWYIWCLVSISKCGWGRCSGGHSRSCGCHEILTLSGHYMPYGVLVTLFCIEILAFLMKIHQLSFFLGIVQSWILSFAQLFVAKWQCLCEIFI